MTHGPGPVRLGGRMQQAVAELQETIRRRYPDARFSLSHPEDEPAGVDLTAVVDVDDPDEVLDTVIDRVVELQVDEQLAIHVTPVRTPERVAAYLAERRHSGRRAHRSMSLFRRPPPGTRLVASVPPLAGTRTCSAVYVWF